MCRWLAYTGSSIPLEALLFNAWHSLIDQSMSSRTPATATNGDGFGIGWYGRNEQPGLFRSVRPAWNDFNLRELAAHIEALLFLAHVRATSRATVIQNAAAGLRGAVIAVASHFGWRMRPIQGAPPR